jgi:hypothetical protein
MEDLIRGCSQLSLREASTPTNGFAAFPSPQANPYYNYLRLKDSKEFFRGLYTLIDLPPNFILGALEGIPSYSWDVLNENYDKVIWVQDDCILDCSLLSPNQMFLSHIRPAHYGSSAINCSLVAYTPEYTEDACSIVGIQTTHPIRAGEELIYWNPNDMV